MVYGSVGSNEQPQFFEGLDTGGYLHINLIQDQKKYSLFMMKFDAGTTINKNQEHTLATIWQYEALIDSTDKQALHQAYKNGINSFAKSFLHSNVQKKNPFKLYVAKENTN